MICVSRTEIVRKLISALNQFTVREVTVRSKSIFIRPISFFGFSLLVSTASLAQSFNDVTSDYWAYDFIEILAANGITGGCGDGNYCPDQPVSRAQMAVFLERGMRGSDFSPPSASGNVFLDVANDDFAAAFIEQLYLDGITGGCGGNEYCPDETVTRAQMAVFLLRAKYGAAHLPAAATGIFQDVDTGYWAASWIEQLAEEGISSGCGGENFCPDQSVTRAQMAVFLVRTFGLEMPGTISLFRESDGFFDPQFDEVSFPYSSNSVINASVLGSSVYTLDSFKLVAKGQAFTIVKLTATDTTGRVAPYFQNLSGGQSIEPGEEIVFDLVSPLTGGAEVDLEFHFEIAETGGTFTADYTFTSN